MVEREDVQLAVVAKSHCSPPLPGRVKRFSCESRSCSGAQRAALETASRSPLHLIVVSTGGPDLFVVCKNCGSEVSPYITECPYCGTRLRKRAPKLDRNGRIAERTAADRRRPSLSRLRRGEIPGIRHEAHPYATILLVLLGVVGCLIWRTDVDQPSQPDRRRQP